MSDPLVISSNTARTSRVILNSPVNRNALSIALLQELCSALGTAVADPETRVIWLGHTGSVFCSGADMKEQVRTFAETGASPGAGGLVPVLELLQNSPKPIVTEVRGAVRGGGMGLVAASDIVVASETATFAFSEARVGVAPAVIAVPVLARIGRAAALELFLTGRTFTAAEALETGLLTRVVPSNQVEEEMGRLITELLQAAPGAQAEIRQLIARVPRLTPEVAYGEMIALSQRLFSSREGQEGMTAFSDRRPPDWA